MSKRLAISERIERDIARGDFALARMRLIDHMCSVGYRGDAAARIARISFEMHDIFEAGRYGLVADEESPELDAAIAEFIRRAGSSPQSVCAALPAAARLTELSGYPERVQRRLRALGLDTAILRRPDRGDPGSLKARLAWGGLVFGAAVIVLALGLIAAIAVGTVTIAVWIGSWLSGR